MEGEITAREEGINYSVALYIVSSNILIKKVFEAIAMYRLSPAVFLSYSMNVWTFIDITAIIMTIVTLRLVPSFSPLVPLPPLAFMVLTNRFFCHHLFFHSLKYSRIHSCIVRRRHWFSLGARLGFSQDCESTHGDIYFKLDRDSEDIDIFRFGIVDCNISFCGHVSNSDHRIPKRTILRVS